MFLYMIALAARLAGHAAGAGPAWGVVPAAHLGALSRTHKMVDQARQLLDRLLGRERNAAQARKPCYFYSLGLCPRSLLVGTKYSVGACELDHIYVKVPSHLAVRYELELLGILLHVCKRACRTTRAHHAISRSGAAKEAKIKKLDSEISQMLASLPFSRDIVRDMAAIEDRKRAAEHLREGLHANDKWIARRRCGICYEPMEPGDTNQKHARHNSTRLHRTFMEMRSVMGELALKHRIGDYSRLEAMQKR